MLIGLVLLLWVGVGFVYWFVIRVEVDAGEILVLVNKTGKSLPLALADQLGDQVVLYPELVRAIASSGGESEDYVREHYKGVRHDVLSEGRYFPNPYSYKTIKIQATSIDQNEMGVLIRKYGKPLAFPKTVATQPDERGPVTEILRPGRHNINHLTYEVQRFPVIQIPEGRVGVVTLLSGREPEKKNTFTVEPGEKGVQRETLPPGLEYYNPYLKRIEIVDVRSHKYDMLGDDAIQFPSNDSFTIAIEGTIEWSIRPDRVAEVAVAYGDEKDILNKIIIPNTRSIARIQGSKLEAREFISGKTRAAFQDRLLSELRSECWQQGIQIRSALVRDILPPAEIASLISQREQADQEIERSTNEMTEAQAEAKLVEQRELQERNKIIGDARRKVVTVVKESELRKVVAVTQANRQFEVGKLELEAAAKQADALRTRGQAEADVVLFNYQARAEPLARSVNAFGDGVTYAQQFFLRRVAPSITSILSNTDGPFAEIFKQLQTFDAKPATGGKQ
ncbi:MAG: SPFH domain-containing protein [Phycisphaerales bacterium]|nr:SPFH domain-containing protein [Phycisphaerales bacterium]